jgi:hypothetical protein
MLRLACAVLALVALVACGPGAPGGPSMGTKLSTDLPPPVSPVVSQDILDREPVANSAQVKHILIAWRDLGDSYGGRLDPRAAQRSKADAERDIKAVLAKLAAGANFEELMLSTSEDPGSASGGRAYAVKPDAPLAIEFRQLSLRLKVGEWGVCESDFGFHIIKRVE